MSVERGSGGDIGSKSGQPISLDLPPGGTKSGQKQGAPKSAKPILLDLLVHTPA